MGHIDSKASRHIKPDCLDLFFVFFSSSPPLILLFFFSPSSPSSSPPPPHCCSRPIPIPESLSGFCWEYCTHTHTRTYIYQTDRQRSLLAAVFLRDASLPLNLRALPVDSRRTGHLARLGRTHGSRIPGGFCFEMPGYEMGVYSRGLSLCLPTPRCGNEASAGRGAAAIYLPGIEGGLVLSLYILCSKSAHVE